MQDPQERVRLAMESVLQWSAISPHTPLVLCDGSGFDFRPMVAQLPNAHQIECLTFQNDSAAVQLHGRGYGEGEIVKYAIENSEQIRTAGAFAKCTSKLWVENFAGCMQQWNGDLLLKGVFSNTFSPLTPTTLAYIDTRFYAANIDIYRKLFLNAHLAVRSQHGHSLEECFKDIFLTAQLKGCLMAPPPIICGVGGGTGVYYTNTPLRKQKERLKYAIAKRDQAFTPWFTTAKRNVLN
ncbi:hypothetical protein [Rhodoferax aquaticus]|uniref:Uncharacterized protein n=1 Tax=Rhodoferax aquaticus TaxID=2527691 RepID=A0A515ENP4_9BURK|nr:hypothetical protein [Rhodoferax aquaticus]QDL54296.1 hypothetical protein EXZ61_09015 [Rhodoferax aquaticus]